MNWPDDDISLASFLIQHPEVLAQHEAELEQYPFRNTHILWVFSVLRRVWVANHRTRFPSKVEATMIVEKEAKEKKLPEEVRIGLVHCALTIYQCDVSSYTGDRVVGFILDRQQDKLQDLIESGDPSKLGEIEELIHSLRTARNSPFQTGSICSTSPFSKGAIAAQLDEDSTSNLTIPLGFPVTDSCMKGGLRVGEVYVLIAYTGGGKTATLGTVARQIAMQGYRVLYCGLDNPKAELDLRFMEAMAGKARHECSSFTEFGGYLNAALGSEWGNLDPTMHLFLLSRKDFRRRPTPSDVGEYVERIHNSREVREYDLKRGVLPKRIGRVDVVVYDYAAKMRPNFGNSKQAKHELLHDVIDDMQESSMALDFAAMTAAQVNRFGYNKDNPDMDDIAGSWDMLGPAGIVSVLCQSDEELQNGTFRLAHPKLRRGALPFTTHFGFDRSTSRVWEISNKGATHLPVGPKQKSTSSSGAVSSGRFKPVEGPLLTPDTYQKVKRSGLALAPGLEHE